MNEDTKRTVITIGGILLLCCFMTLMASVMGYGVWTEIDKRINIGPGDSAQAAENIATMDIPAGYTLTSGMSMLVFDMATLTPTSDKSLPSIMLVQFSKYISIDIENVDIESGDSLPVVDSFQITIRGKERTVTVREDSRSRHWTVIFDGNAGDALFMAEGSISGWDEGLLLDFLNSIR